MDGAFPDGGHQYTQMVIKGGVVIAAVLVQQTRTPGTIMK